MIGGNETCFVEDLGPTPVEVSNSKPKFKTFLVPDCLHVLGEITIEMDTNTIICQANCVEFVSSIFLKPPFAPDYYEQYIIASRSTIVFYFQDVENHGRTNLSYLLEFESEDLGFYFNVTIENDGSDKFSYSFKHGSDGVSLKGSCKYRLFATTIDNKNGLQSTRKLVSIFSTLPYAKGFPVTMEFQNGEMLVSFLDTENCWNNVHYNFELRSYEKPGDVQRRSSGGSHSVGFEIEEPQPGSTYFARIEISSSELGSISKFTSTAKFTFPSTTQGIDAYLVLETATHYEIAIKDTANSRLNFICEHLCDSYYSQYQIKIVSLEDMDLFVQAYASADNNFAIINKTDISVFKGLSGGCLLNVYVGINSEPQVLTTLTFYSGLLIKN